jgi:hypothetical protein
VSPLGSLPRFELFLLRIALWTLVLLPFWDDRLLLVMGAIAGKGSVFFVAMVADDFVQQGERKIVEYLERGWWLSSC